MTVHTGYGLYIETENTSAAAVLIGGITQQRLMTGSEPDQEAVAGSHYPFIATIPTQSPRAELTTRDISNAFDAVLPPSAKIATLGASLYQVKKTDGLPDSGSVNRKWAFADGLIIPRQLSCQQGGHAELALEILGRYNGTAEPIVPTESQALAGTLADPVRYTMGTLSLGGITGGITGRTSLDIDFGITANQIATDGDVWPTEIEVESYLARITIRSIDVDLVAAAKVPLVGKAFTHANTTGYFRKRSGGSFVADGTLEHISWTANGLCYAENVFDAQGNRRGECDLVMLCTYDGSTVPIDISTGVAIT